MPARFVEVVDVSAEAASTLSVLLTRGGGLVGNLSSALHDYINATNASTLWAALANYSNLTVDDMPTHWQTALQDMGMNVTLSPDELAPEGRARNYLLTALVLVVSRELFVRWRVGRMLRAHGVHKH